MAVQTNDSMINKRVKLLDGTRAKIVKVLASSYRLDNDEKIPARKVMQKGRSFVETELTMRDLEDTGAGFVVKAEAEEKKAPAKKKSTSRGTKQSKNSTKETKKPRRSRKAKAEQEEEKPSRSRKPSRSKKADKEDAQLSRRERRQAKKAQEAKAAKTSKPKAEKTKEREILDFSTASPLDKIREFVRTDLNEYLVERYSNVNAVVVETSRAPKNQPDQGEIRLHIVVDVPKPEHHSTEYYLEIAKAAGANCRTPSEKVQNRLADLLEIEEADFVLEVGQVLLSEDGTYYVFAGIIAADKQFALVAVKDEQVQKIKYSGFEALDWTGSNVEEIFGPSIETVGIPTDEEITESDDDDFELEEGTTTPLSAIDWENTDREVLMDLLSDNYDRDTIIEFIIDHPELEPSDEDLELPDAELIEMLVDVMTESEEEFEDDVEDGDADLDDADDELEDEDLDGDDLDEDEFETVEAEEVEEDDLDESEEVEDDLDEEVEDSDDADEVEEEVELDAATRKEMVNALIEAEELTPKMAKRMSDDDLAELYSELFPDEAEDEDEVEEELTPDEMREELIAEEELTKRLAAKMSDDEIIELYNDVFGDVHHEGEDDLDDEDGDDVEDDLDEVEDEEDDLR